MAWLLVLAGDPISIPDLHCRSTMAWLLLLGVLTVPGDLQ